MAKAPKKVVCLAPLLGVAGPGKTIGKKAAKKPAAKKVYTQEKLDKVRLEVSKSHASIGLIYDDVYISLQNLRDQVDELVKKYGPDAIYYLSTDIEYGYYDERTTQISEKITTTRQETDAEVTERLDKNAVMRVARAATKKANKEAQERADREELSRLQKLYGGDQNGS